MKRLFVVFFLSLCALLLSGYHDAYASTHRLMVKFRLNADLEKAKAQQIGRPFQDFSNVDNPIFSGTKDEFISSENDDDDLLFSRKYVLLAKQFAAITYAFSFFGFFKSSKSKLPFCSYFSYSSSYKYILQRVLRI